MNEPTYDPMKEIESETWTSRGLFDPHNYAAIVAYSLLVLIIDCLLGHGIWKNIAWTFTLLPSTLEQILFWKVVISVAVTSFWQFVFWGLLGEGGTVALPGSILSFVILMYSLP